MGPRAVAGPQVQLRRTQAEAGATHRGPVLSDEIVLSSKKEHPPVGLGGFPHKLSTL